MFKFITVLALVAAASAAPQAITYDLPAGQASFTLGAQSAASSKLLQVVSTPQFNFADADTVHVVAAHSPTQHFVIAPASKPAPKPEPVNPNPQYSYSYSVNDAKTGDNKVASETRDGDNVSGRYSLVEPDGAIRTVTYTADADNGFNAKVERTPSANPGVTIIPGPKPKPVQPVRPVIQAIPYSAQSSKNIFSFLQGGINAGSFQLVPAGINSGSFQLIPAGLNSGSFQLVPSGINSGNFQLIPAGLNSGSFQLVPAGTNAAFHQGQGFVVLRH